MFDMSFDQSLIPLLLAEATSTANCRRGVHGFVTLPSRELNVTLILTTL